MKALIICLCICSALLPFGCAGRDPNPIPITMQGDENRTCESLETEMSQIQGKMKELEPHIDKFGTNVFWFLFFTPLMDVKDAEKIEYRAYQERYDRLIILGREKECWR